MNSKFNSIGMIGVCIVTSLSSGTATAETWTVRSGDSLLAISQEVFGTPTRWQEICELNELSNCNRINTGAVLQLPSSDDTTTVTQSTVEPAVTQTSPTEDVAEPVPETERNVPNLLVGADNPLNRTVWVGSQQKHGLTITQLEQGRSGDVAFAEYRVTGVAERGFETGFFLGAAALASVEVGQPYTARATMEFVSGDPNSVNALQLVIVELDGGQPVSVSRSADVRNAGPSTDVEVSHTPSQGDRMRVTLTAALTPGEFVNYTFRVAGLSLTQ